MGYKPCTIDGCERKITARGLCPAHYAKLKRYGDPLGAAPPKGVCSVDSCDRPHMALGYCTAHYQRVKRHGSDMADVPLQELTRDRLKRLSRLGPDACWDWDGQMTDGGYGLAWANGRKTTAHRVAYETLVGPIPDDLQIDHLCRNRACVRPDHLEPVTCAENLRRAREARKKEQEAA